LSAFIKGSIPFVMLFTNGISSLFSGYCWYEQYFYSGGLGLDFGFSFVCAPVFIWYYFRKSFCFFPKSCVLGLIMMLLISRIGVIFDIDFPYKETYDTNIAMLFIAIGIAAYTNGK